MCPGQEHVQAEAEREPGEKGEHANQRHVCSFTQRWRHSQRHQSEAAVRMTEADEAVAHGREA
jgi:hypothetical protein